MYSLLEELNEINTDNVKLTEMYAHSSTLPYKFSEQGILSTNVILDFLRKYAEADDVIEVGVYEDISYQFDRDCIDPPKPTLDPLVSPFRYTYTANRAGQYVTTLNQAAFSLGDFAFTTIKDSDLVLKYYFEYEAEDALHERDIISKTTIYEPSVFKNMIRSGSALTPKLTCDRVMAIEPGYELIFYVGIEGKGAIGHPAAGKPLVDTKSATRTPIARPSRFVSDLELTGIAREAFPDALEEVLSDMKLFTSFQVDNALTFTGKLSGRETEIDVIRLTLEKWDEDDGKLTLLLDKTILDHSEQIQLAAAIKQVLIDEGYGHLAFIGVVSRPYRGRQLCEVKLRYII